MSINFCDKSLIEDMKNILSLILLLLSFGCQNQTHLSEFNIEQIDVPKEINEDFSYVKSARYVFLDSIIPIGKIGKLIVSKEKIIIFDQMSSSVNIYDTTGVFLQSIKAKGNGPGEYVKIQDIAYNDSTEEVLILDAEKFCVLNYSVEDGKFTKKMQLEYQPTSISVISDKLFFYNPFYFNYKNIKDEKYSLYVKFNNNESRFFKNPKFHHVKYQNKGLFRCNDSILLFNNKLSNEIIVFHGLIPTKGYKINFEGNEQVNSCIDNIKSGLLTNEFYDSEFAFGINNICYSDKFLYFTYIRSRTLFHTLINIETNMIISHTNRKSILSNNYIANKIWFNRYPEYSYNNSFISVIEPQEIIEVYENLKLDNSMIDKTLMRFKNLKYSDNPIIAFYDYEN